MCFGELGVVEETWDEGGVPMASVKGDPVCLIYTPQARQGDSVLVHLGFVVEILDEERATSALTLRSEVAEHLAQREAS